MELNRISILAAKIKNEVTITDILADHGIQVTLGKNICCPLPGHDDKSPSFSIIDNKSFNCFGCGAKGSVIKLEELLSNLSNEQAIEAISARRNIAIDTDWEAEYTYHDMFGNEAYRVRKYVDNGKKDMRQGHMKAGRWVANIQGIPRVPYQLHKWGVAPKDTADASPVFIVEGEKDVHTVEKWGLHGTCNSGGSGNFADTLGQYFEGRNVVIVPDNDEAGEKHVTQVIQVIAKFAKTIKTVRLNGLAPKEDISDWAPSNSKEQFLKLVDALPPLTEDQVKYHLSIKIDRRSCTSADNGSNGGKKSKTKLIADSFIGAYPHLKKHRGQFLQYNKGYFHRISKDDLHSLIMGYLRKKHPDNATNNMLRAIEGHINAIDVGGIPSKINLPCWSDFKHAPGWLVMKNKIINVELIAAGEEGLKKHTPDLVSTFNLDYDYVPGKSCQKWLKYLNEVQPEKENIEAIQMLFGLSLVPETSFDVFFIFFGKSGTGKSVCLEILTALIGPDNVACVPLNKFAEKHSTHLLTENLLNIVGDLPTAGNGTNLSQIEGLLKDVISGGLVPVERKGIDPIKAPAIARCIFATNSLPNFADRSRGVWDRLRIIPFNVKFRNTEKMNPYLSKDIIADELPGILNWSIVGLKKLREKGEFQNTREGEKLTEDHRLHCDHEQEFLNEFYKSNYDGCVIRQELYDHYRDFCHKNNYSEKHQGNFNKEVIRIFPHVKKGRKNKKRAWKGIAKHWF